MTIPGQIASHFRGVYFGGNWTSVNLKETLSDVGFEKATKKIHSLNTIASLVFHINYYVSEVMKVLKGGPLEAHDSFSFAAPILASKEDWDKLLDKSWSDAAEFAGLVEKLPESILLENFTDEKYGSYYSNLHGIIEHAHYHLGQIVLIKKLLSEPGEIGSIH